MTLNTRRVRLIGATDRSLKQTVTIVPEKKYFFEITQAIAQKGQFIKYDLAKVNASDSVQYQLTVENTRKEQGRYFDIISLKTTSKYQPEIKISVFGSIVPPNQQPAAKN